jgi:hypothetical protein
MGQWKDTTAAAEMLAIQVSALSRCHYYLQMAGQGGFASGHRRYGAQKRLEGERRQKNEQERWEAERLGGPTTGAQGTREARTTTVLVGRISRKESVEAGNLLFGDCRSQGAQS